MVVGQRGMVLRWCPVRGWYGLDLGTSLDLLIVMYSDEGTSWVGGVDGVIVCVDDDMVTLVFNGLVKDIQGVSSGGSLVFMVGDQGLVVCVDSTSIEEEDMGTLLFFNDVWLSDEGTGFVVGAGGTIVVRVNDGIWLSQVSGIMYGLYVVVGVGEQAWAVGDYGVLLYWDGQGWIKELMFINLSGKYFYGLWVHDILGVIVVGWFGTVFW